MTRKSNVSHLKGQSDRLCDHSPICPIWSHDCLPRNGHGAALCCYSVPSHPVLPWPSHPFSCPVSPRLTESARRCCSRKARQEGEYLLLHKAIALSLSSAAHHSSIAFVIKIVALLYVGKMANDRFRRKRFASRSVSVLFYSFALFSDGFACRLDCEPFE